MSSQWAEFRTPEGVPYFYNAATGESSWDKPAELMSEDERDSGDWVWYPDEEEGFIKAQMYQQCYDGSCNIRTEKGQVFNVPKKHELIPLTLSSLGRLVSDLVLLDDMNPALIGHMLRERCKKDEIYTYVGNILVSVNPYRLLPLYTPSVMEKYHHNNKNNEQPPHVFAIADECFVSMVETKINQSIIISGESGAGKTEAFKVILQYLAEIAGSKGGVEQKILLANPILEAFGNAKTLRNNNSSRFGKWVEIHFDKEYKICGAKIVQYLLEKARVISQSAEERNFHVFYMLTKGASSKQRAELKLKGPEHYRLIAGSGCIDIPGLDDVEEFHEVEAAFERLQFTVTERQEIFRLLAAILHLGNLQFTEYSERTGEHGSQIGNPDVLAIASDLLRVSSKDLTASITFRYMHIKGHEPMQICLAPDKAGEVRDSLCATLYSNLFRWLVDRINDTLTESINLSVQNVGVLDIFGFEIFEKNSFEQMCINYANEMLQQHFNAHTFKLEEAVYQEERIQYTHVEFIDNQIVVDLVEKKPTGILPMLDEEIVMPQGTDETFLRKLHSKHDKQHPRYKRPLKSTTTFIMAHYAGEVVYDVTGFLDKNRDTIYEDLLKLITGSGSAFIRKLFAGETAGTRKVTLGTQFKHQLGDLMVTLNATEPHYIRCIKPNHTKTPSGLLLCGGMVLRQLRYSGVFEAVKIRQTGFPFRLTHDQFYKRYRMLCPTVKGSSKLDTCRKMLQAIPRDLSGAQLGKTKVLYRAAQHREVELLRNIAIERASVTIQKYYRRWSAMKLKKALLALRKEIVAAVKKRTLEALDAVLAKSRQMAFEIYDAVQARELRVVVQEEVRITKIIKGLLSALGSNLDPPKSKVDELTAIMAAADKISFESTDVSKGRETLHAIKERIETRENLKKGVAESDLLILRKAVAAADRLKIAGEPAAQAAKKELQRIEEEDKFLSKIRVALSLPPPGEDFDATKHMLPGFDVNEVGDVTLTPAAAALLPEALAGARKFGVRTPQGKQLLELGEIVGSLRAALARDAWDEVETLLLGSTKKKIPRAPEILAAEEALVYRANVAQVQEKLDTSARCRDEATLTLAIEQAKPLNMVVDAYEELLGHVVTTREMVENALEQVELSLLVDALAMADWLEYNTDQVAQARWLHDTILHLNHQLSLTLRALPDRPNLEALYKQCTDVGMHTQEVMDLGGYLALNEEDLTKAQLKAAKEMGDHERFIDLSIKLKEIFFGLFGKQFVVHECPRLKTPEEFARSKLFGKDKVRDNMMVWSKESIHAPLTRMEGVNQKAGVRMFKNILGYMGDRQLSYPQMLAKEILDVGTQTLEVRDEVFMQLVKQLTQNPSRESEQKGWRLLHLCLQTWPPGSEIENYFEIFLRERRDTTPAAADALKMLHQIVYSGARPRARTVELAP